MSAPRTIIASVAAGLLLGCAFLACSSRVAGPESRCDSGDATQTLAMTPAMCAGAAGTSSPSASSASAEVPPAPPAASASASAAAPVSDGPPAAPAPSSPLLDPATCDLDCARACGGVPDSVCKRLSEKEIECRINRPHYPGC